jgi:hypothetical protein
MGGKSNQFRSGGGYFGEGVKLMIDGKKICEGKEKSQRKPLKETN